MNEFIFHTNCFGYAHSHDMYSDDNFCCLMTCCGMQNNKIVPVVYPTVDCKMYEELEEDE